MHKESSSSFSADEVVAPGKSPQYMQLPSPVYFVRWVDECHAIIGAGGGGRRFGMANLLAIISVDSTQGPCGTTPSGKQQQRRPQKEPLPPPIPWNFVAAIDMEGNIPWCASTFLICTDRTQLARGVVGYIAVSHITCFTLVEVYQCCKANTLAMRRLACIEVPADAKNPDKKPIALVQGAVVVAHDEGGVYIYGLHSLVQRAHSTVEEKAVRKKVEKEAKAQNASPSSSVTGEAQDTVVETPRILQEAEPLAVWSLPARLNDLHANRFFVPKRKPGIEGSRKRHLSEHMLIVALVQDKTLRLATMKLPRRAKTIYKQENRDKNEGKDTTCLVDACMFTGKDCRVPFSLMKSSMRLVQVFGVEDVAPSKAELIWLKARRLHRETGVRGAMPIASFIVVVYDVLGNQSYMLTARVSSTAKTCNEFSFSKASEPESNAGKKPSKRLALQVCFAPQPSPLVKEGITSISACHYRRPCHECGAVSGEGVGTIVPSYWLAGTVEGTLAFIAHAGNGTFQTMLIRPSKNKREARKFPALHREPISCVAVSPINDVLTTDIAQNVVVSTLPFCEESQLASSLCDKSKDVTSHVPCREGRMNCSVNDDRAATCTGSDAITAVADPTLFAGDGKEAFMRPKCVALSLFPPKQGSTSSLLLLLSWAASFSVRLLVAVVIVPPIAMLMAYWFS
ncbi:hypothetical protein MOQ_003115 [Trypanosoma cruzi marinkellei]|uniref:Uncharacterized protein n=1 Tax=Trypanosoma cruzi marinkellei TaxID=85056 RepID=K2NDM6_TRYCR|nr:hypothetical protein MOQ_003115 [Trypanosoma cruzi marinkellei]